MQLLNLWKALMRFHHHYTLPKALASALHPVIKLANSRNSVSDPDLEQRSFWSIEEGKTLKTIPSPSNLITLLRAMIWVAPDRRYFAKEHLPLWQNFLSLLATDCDHLMATGQSTEIIVGEVTLLLPELLLTLFRRIHESVWRPRVNGDGKGIEVEIAYVPVYLDCLYSLASLVLRYTTSPQLISDILPKIWDFGLALCELSPDSSERISACESLGHHLGDVLGIADGGNRLKSEKKRELLEALQEVAVDYMLLLVRKKIVILTLTGCAISNSSKSPVRCPNYSHYKRLGKELE